MTRISPENYYKNIVLTLRRQYRSQVQQTGQAMSWNQFQRLNKAKLVQNYLQGKNEESTSKASMIVTEDNKVTGDVNILDTSTKQSAPT